MRHLFVPTMQADETAYSLVAAVHHINGISRAEDTSMAMFGEQGAGRGHDLLPYIPRLGHTLGWSDETTLEVLRRNTVVAYYAPFATPERFGELGTSRADGGAWNPVRALGIGSRTLPVWHPLKWCEECARADTTSLGRPLWRTAHQFPTTQVCLVHGRVLQAMPRRYRRWLLPGELRGVENHLLDPAHENVSRALAEVGAELRSISCIDMETLRAEAVQRLRELGVFHDAQKAWHLRLTAWFSESATGRALRASPSPLRQLERGDWIATLLFRRKSTSAVRWILLWAAVGLESPGGAGKAFADAVRGLRRRMDGQLALFSEMPEPYRAPQRVWDCMTRANSYEEAMAELKASRHDVGRWFSSDLALKSMWKGKLQRCRVEEAVSRLRALLHEHPETTSGSLESGSRSEADVKYLRMHAPSLLNEIRKGLVPRAAAQRDLFDEARRG